MSDVQASTPRTHRTCDVLIVHLASCERRLFPRKVSTIEVPTCGDELLGNRPIGEIAPAREWSARCSVGGGSVICSESEEDRKFDRWRCVVICWDQGDNHK